MDYILESLKSPNPSVWFIISFGIIGGAIMGAALGLIMWIVNIRDRYADPEWKTWTGLAQHIGGFALIIGVIGLLAGACTAGGIDTSTMPGH